MSRPPIHPGETLADELKVIGVTVSELARQLNLSPSRLSRIVNGKQDITADTALRLGHWFGNSAQFWLNLQTAFELRRAEESSSKEIQALPVRSATPA